MGGNNSYLAGLSGKQSITHFEHRNGPETVPCLTEYSQQPHERRVAPFYKQGNRGTGKPSNLPKVTQLESDRTKRERDDAGLEVSRTWPGASAPPVPRLGNLQAQLGG